MNNAQIKYLKERLYNIKSEHRRKLSNPVMTPDEKRNAIDNGNYNIEVTNSGYVTVVFPEFQEKLEASMKIGNEIESQYNEILDKIMFAEQEDVLKLLEDFRNFKV